MAPDPHYESRFLHHSLALALLWRTRVLNRRLRSLDPRRGVAGAQRADEGDELQDLLLAHLVLEARHDRLIAGDDLGPGVEDRFAQVLLVGGDRPAVVEADGRAVEVF